MPINQHEEALVVSAQSGNTSAFEELYQLYYDKIYALIMMTVKNSADAEDILQITFVKAWQNIGNLSDPKAFNTWLQRIALNESKSLLRKKRPDLSVDDEGENGELLQIESDLLLPQEYTERDDLSARLRKIIEELSVVQRDTILLFYYNEMSIEEIAQIMDCSEGTVKSRLFLARKAIKTEIEEQERKSGEKFYGAVLLPFGPMFNNLVGSQSVSSEAALRIWGAVNQSIAGTAASSAAGSVAAGTAAKAELSLGAKIAIGVLIGVAVIGGAVFGVSQMLKPNTPVDTASSAVESVVQTTEAEQTTEAPTEEPTEADYSKAYADYLQVLYDNQSSIKQYSDEPNKFTDRGIILRPIAFVDLVGDETPEMIYIKQLRESNGTLSIVSYQDGSVSEIYTDENFATRISHGPRYFIFTSDGSLYAESVDGGKENENFTFYRFDPDDSGKLEKNMIMTGRYSADLSTPISFEINGAEVSQEKFELAKERLLASAETAVMDNTAEKIYSEDAAAAERFAELGSKAMTYEEAIDYLNGYLSKAAAEKSGDISSSEQKMLSDIASIYETGRANSEASAVEFSEDGTFYSISMGSEKNIIGTVTDLTDKGNGVYSFTLESALDRFDGRNLVYYPKGYPISEIPAESVEEINNLYKHPDGDTLDTAYIVGENVSALRMVEQ